MANVVLDADNESSKDKKSILAALTWLMCFFYVYKITYQ